MFWTAFKTRLGVVRILITQRALIQWAGTEMITIEIARELSRRGHDVAVFSPRIGPPSNLVLPSGVSVKSRLSEIPWRPDLIHGHHHLQAMAALSYFGEAPAIYCCHGAIPWPELAPVHPRIRKYVVMCEWLAPRLYAASGISRDRIAVIPNFVNTARFSNVRRPSTRPAQALLFGGSGFSSDELLCLHRACTEQGLSLDKIGYPYGNPQERPEAFLPTYDLVFAIGKCAIEAIACGCAVIPIVPGLAGHLVNPDNFEKWAFSNFSPRYFTSAEQVSTEWLRAELQCYSPEAVARVTAHVRETRTLTAAVDQLETVYAHAIGDYERNVSGTIGEFAPYLEKLSVDVDIIMENQLEIDEIRFKLGSQQQYVDELQRQIIELQRSYAELLVLQIQKFKASRSHLLKGLIASIFRKGLWS